MLPPKRAQSPLSYPYALSTYIEPSTAVIQWMFAVCSPVLFRGNGKLGIPGVTNKGIFPFEKTQPARRRLVCQVDESNRNYSVWEFFERPGIYLPVMQLYLQTSVFKFSLILAIV